MRIPRRPFIAEVRTRDQVEKKTRLSFHPRQRCKRCRRYADFGGFDSAGLCLNCRGAA